MGRKSRSIYSKMCRKNNSNKSNREGERNRMRRDFEFSDKSECADEVSKRPPQGMSEEN